MDTVDGSYTCSASTHCVCGRCIIQGPRPAQKSARLQDAPLRRLARRDPRKPLTIEIRYVGGPESLWAVRARGQTWKVCAHECVADVFMAFSAAVWAVSRPEGASPAMGALVRSSELP